MPPTIKTYSTAVAPFCSRNERSLVWAETNNLIIKGTFLKCAGEVRKTYQAEVYLSPMKWVKQGRAERWSGVDPGDNGLWGLEVQFTTPWARLGYKLRSQLRESP